MGEGKMELIHHAMLIAWGQYARSLGLVKQLESIPIKQKTVIHSPQRNIMEYLVAILGGLRHLKDISLAAHPLDQDKAVAKAWDQKGWVDYSGVSRTLANRARRSKSGVCVCWAVPFSLFT